MTHEEDGFNDPAFPVTEPVYPSAHHPGWANGLTKREYFAGLALQGLLSNTELNKPNKFINTEAWLGTMAQSSVDFADKLLEKLNE